ncbi:MAG: hypothetical protein ACFFCV_21150 [Promethearchaeota archaeon]
MKKSLKSLKVLLIIIFPCINLFFVQTVKANVTYSLDRNFAGGLLPKENCSLSLISANVKIEVDTSDLKFLGEIHFKGNYTINNPDGEINVTIGAPFNFYPFDNCTIIVNDTKIPFIIVRDYDIDEYNSTIWDQYMWNTYYPKTWFLCNVSIPQNSSINIKYDFFTSRPNYAIMEKRFYIIYDVGTARLWNGNITEMVEIKAQENPPTKIYGYESCDINAIPNGMSYKWEWIEERININYVGLYYNVNLTHEYDYLYNSLKFIFLLAISAIGISLVQLKKKFSLKKRKQKEP